MAPFACMDRQFHEVAPLFPLSLLYIVEVMEVFKKAYAPFSGTIAAISAKNECLITKLKSN